MQGHWSTRNLLLGLEEAVGAIEAAIDGIPSFSEQESEKAAAISKLSDHERELLGVRSVQLT